jgi:anti-sigma factor RsiW
MKETFGPLASGHLANDQLLRALDDELSAAEAGPVEEHLAVCEECKGRYREFGGISVRVERFVSAASTKVDPAERGEIARQLREREAIVSNARRVRSAKGAAARRQTVEDLVSPSGGALETATVLREFLKSFRGPARWSIAIAAGLLLAVLFLPRPRLSPLPAPVTAAGMAQTFQVSGETFVALPYSNAELPMSALHIVEMQVPVSSLAEAGVIFEPVSIEQANPDRAVLADVLFGLDGEPLGVHVIDAD